MRRRELLAGLVGVAAARPLAAGAQKGVPVIGFLSSASPDLHASLLQAFREGLRETGYVEGRNVAIEYRWANGQNERLPALAAELVSREVSVIAAPGSTPAVLAAKEATATIPIVFQVGIDPVAAGLVASIARPGGNVTGLTGLNTELGVKRLELLRELVPTANAIALLINPTSSLVSERITRELQSSARALGVQLHIVQASTERDFDPAFATLAQTGVSGLVIAPDALFISRSDQLAALTLRHAVPTITQFREFVAAGGLMSYGGNLTDVYRLCGVYAGRILKGEKPADLPVQQLTKVELIVNLKTARALGLAVPPTLLARADEVIE
jgi:ABC-type uncharacterized transport system substrate-binding protein